jgi:2-dehydro-3-deoxyphosphogluconate aldolase/(4S)-4-hydroxy-2-oxoglutarate aldolase
MNEVLQTISNIGIVPVIAFNSVEEAVPLCKALVAGGLPAAEVTFRTACAEECIRTIAKEVPEMLLGAGTVLTCEQADRAMDAGAKFIVAPGYDPKVTQHIIDKGGLMMPGTASAGEMQQAMNQGCEVLKFFPAEANGGVAMLKNIGAALKSCKWMCTGGVNAKNVNDYLGYDQIVAVGGTWMCKSDMIKAGEWDKITALCKEAVKTMLGFTIQHVGINCANEDEASNTAKFLCAAFGLDYKPGNSSIFAGSAVECMKTPYLGKNGHIAIGTNSVDRAVYHLSRQGVEFDESTRKTDAKGKTKAIYLKGEWSGFAIHLVQK